MVRFYDGPRIYCPGGTAFDAGVVRQIFEEHYDEWGGGMELDMADDAATLVEFAGRTCYLSFGRRKSPRTNGEYILNLLKQGHGSVLEHPSWSFFIEGVSRSLTHELIRHRVGIGISQVSQRYVDEPKLLGFVVPPQLQGRPAEDEEWGVFRRYCEMLADDYGNLVTVLAAQLATEHPGLTKHERKKQAAEAARAILPNATETKLVWTINARALRNFLHKRGQMGVDLEMRRFACALGTWVLREAGDLFPDLAISDGPDGREQIVLEYVPI